MSTIKDVAQAAGVSTATVSHVINGTRFVSSEIQKRVKAAMEQMNYQPNVLARGLRTNRTNILALIIPDITNPYFSDFTRGFQDVADQDGFLVVVCNTDRLLDRELRFLETMRQQRVDGIVLNPAKVTAKDLQQIVDAHIDVVLIGSQIDHPDFDAVMVDNVRGGYDAVQHLYDLGHRRIGLVCGMRSTSSGMLRYQGYVEALQANKLPFEEQLVQDDEITYEGGYRSMQRLLAQANPPTAVFAMSDVMALGAKTAIESAGLQIPRDISLIGFDDIEEVSRTSPKLCTIAQPRYEMGQTAARVLLENIHSAQKLPRKKIVMEHKLVVRDSTAPPS